MAKKNNKAISSRDPQQMCQYILSVDNIDDDESDALYARGYDDDYVAGTTYGKYDESYRYHPYAKEFRKMTVAEKKKAFNELVEVLKTNKPGDKEYEQAYAKIFASLYGFIAGLVSGMGKKYLATTTREDLYQSAYLGVIKHIKEYDPSRGGQPSTYFFGHIRLELQGCMRNVVGNNKYYTAAALRVQRAMARFENENRSYTVIDLARATNMSINTIERAIKCINMSNVGTLDDLNNLESNENNPVIAAEDAERRTIVADAINNLNEMQKQAILLIYGFVTGKKMSITKAAAHMGTSPDCVKKALSSAERVLAKDRRMAALLNIPKTESNDYEAALRAESAMHVPSLDVISGAEVELIDDGGKS